MDNENDEIEETINSMLSPELKDYFYYETKKIFFQQLPIFSKLDYLYSDMNNLIQELVYKIN